MNIDKPAPVAVRQPARSADASASRSAEASASATETDETNCPRCGESQQLAKVKGCIKCLKCGFKFDCNGW